MEIRIGTRGSNLALAQAEEVKNKLLECAAQRNFAFTIKIVPIVTSGDKCATPLADIGGKELFTKEIDAALIAKNIDISVHSMKDVSACFSDKIVFAAFLKREKPNDVFLSAKYTSLSEMPHGSKIGTCSIRRALQLSEHLILPLRGNVVTRISKCNSGYFDGIILAYSGIKRLGLLKEIREIIPCDKIIPAIGQGIIAVHSLKENIGLLEILAQITHAASEKCALIERSFVERINGNCRTPMGGIAEILLNDKIALKAMLATKKGIFYTYKEGNISDSKYMGKEVAEELIINSQYDNYSL